MDANFKTVETGVTNTTQLQIKQRADVAKMRASLLSCDADPNHTVESLKAIAVLQIQHQFARIINYLDIMDKIEQKLYATIETTLENLDETDPTAWATLITIQARLQKNIIESNKLLEPYLGIDAVNNFSLVVDTTEALQSSATTTSDVKLDKSGRDKLRIAAQNVLNTLSKSTATVSNSTETVEIEVLSE